MKQAIVTGASKGLGNAFAHQLAAIGYNLLLVARSEEILSSEANVISEKYSVSVKFLALDLSNPNAAENILGWCNQNQFQPSVLVNNAGYACWGYFEKIDWPSQLRMMQVNMNAVANLCHVLIPVLKKQKGTSYILNVASSTAFQSVPTLALYAASKSFVRSFSRSLRFELKSSNVSVTCLSPGPVATNFIKQAGMEAMQQTAAKFEMQAGDVAKRGLQDMFRKKSESTPGFLNWVNIRLTFIVPDSVLEKIAANLYLSKL